MKAVFYLLVIAFAVSIAAREISPNRANSEQRGCLGHGSECVAHSQCCNDMRCHSYLARCAANITPEMLQNQYKKIKERSEARRQQEAAARAAAAAA